MTSVASSKDLAILAPTRTTPSRNASDRAFASVLDNARSSAEQQERAEAAAPVRAQQASATRADIRDRAEESRRPEAQRRPDESNGRDPDQVRRTRDNSDDRNEDRPEPGAKSASDRGEAPPGLEKRQGTAPGEKPGRATPHEQDEIPPETAAATDQGPVDLDPEPAVQPTDTSASEAMLADALSNAAPPGMPAMEMEGAAPLAADAVLEDNASATGSAPAGGEPFVGVPAPLAPVAMNEDGSVVSTIGAAKLAEATESGRLLDAAAAADAPPSEAITKALEAAKVARTETGLAAEPPPSASEAQAKSGQAKDAFARETSGSTERPAAPNAPPGLASPAGASAEAASPLQKPAADPAQAMARADAPVPLQAVAVEIGMRAMRGAREFAIRLDPEDLGRIDIKLEISEAGEVQAKLVVERVETLQLLQRDARTLERAFDQAGLKTNPDALQFSLRDPGGQSGSERQQHSDARRPGGVMEPVSTIDDIPLHPAAYRMTAAGGLDIRI